MVVVEMALNQGQDQLNVITVKEEVKLDLARVFLLFNKLALNAMEMEKLLVRLVKNVMGMGKFKATNQYQ